MSRKRWLAIYTRPRYEKKVEKFLTDSGVDCYLPTIKTLRQWSDRKKWVEMPLFSSYVFVHITELEYFNVLNTPGVVNYVKFEGEAAEIPEKQIETIKWLLSTDIETVPVSEILNPGDKVEVIKGPLKGLVAEMVDYRNTNIILLRISELNKSIEIKIPRSHVVVVHNS